MMLAFEDVEVERYSGSSKLGTQTNEKYVTYVYFPLFPF